MNAAGQQRIARVIVALLLAPAMTIIAAGRVTAARGPSKAAPPM
jgi:hypothetical protein